MSETKDQDEEPGLAYEEGQSPEIGLKGAPLPAGGGKIRSPLVNPDLNRQQAPEPPQMKQEVPKGGAPAKAPVADHTRSLFRDIGPRTQLGAFGPSEYVMSDPYVVRRRILIVAVLLVLSGSFAAGMYYSPEFRGIVLDTYDHVANKIGGYDEYKQERRLAEKKRREEKRFVAKDLSAKGSQLVGSDCRQILQDNVGVTKLSQADRIKVAECFLIHDDPMNAEKTLDPLEGPMERLPDAKLNALSGEGTLADAFHMQLSIYLKQGKPREADRLLNGRCRVWGQNHACVGKLTALVTRGFTDSAEQGLSRMKPGKAKLDRKTQARYMFAVAQIHAQKRQNGKADQYYRLALNSAPRTSQALRKEIYESYAKHLYHRGDYLKLKRTVSEAMKDLTGVDKGGRTKLLVLNELAQAKDRRATLRKILSREDVTFRARSDLDLMTILGPEAIRTNMADEYLKLLKHTRAHFSTKFGASKYSLKDLSLWEIRALLALERYEPALQAIKQYGSEYTSDHVSDHLKGVAFFKMNPNRNFQLEAAAAFQASLRRRRNWEGLYALGVAMIRSGHKDRAPPVIQDLRNFVTTRGQLYWLDMLRAEWYIAEQKYANAKEILDRWQKDEPEFFLPHELAIQSLKKQGNEVEARRLDLVLDGVRAKVHYASSREGISSPVGPMALADRPID